MREASRIQLCPSDYNRNRWFLDDPPDSSEDLPAMKLIASIVWVNAFSNLICTEPAREGAIIFSVLMDEARRR